MIRRRRRQPRRRRRQRRWRLWQVVKPAAAAGQRGSCAVDSIASLRKLTALPRGSQEEEGGGGQAVQHLASSLKALPQSFLHKRVRLPRLRQQLTKLPLLLSRWPNAKVVALVLVCCAAVLFVPQVAVAIYTSQPKVGFMGHSNKLQLSSNIMDFFDSLEVI